MTKYNGLEITITINKNLDTWGLDESEFDVSATMENVGDKLSEYAKSNYPGAKIEIEITNEIGIKSVSVTCWRNGDDDFNDNTNGAAAMINDDIEGENEQQWGEWVVYKD